MSKIKTLRYMYKRVSWLPYPNNVLAYRAHFVHFREFWKVKVAYISESIGILHKIKVVSTNEHESMISLPIDCKNNEDMAKYVEWRHFCYSRYIQYPAYFSPPSSLFYDQL